MKFQPPRGTQDFLPEDMIIRNRIFDTVRSVYEKWGYDPLETPALEEWKLLAAKLGGGEEIKKEIYYFKDKSKRELGLRFDLTVPLARVVATNPQLPKPFKRYQIGRVWRYDKPGSGRRREFWQSDIDVIGSSSPEADAEVIAVACECLEKLGFKDFTVRLNNRKILESFVKSLKIKDYVQVFRSVDKLEKIGEKGVEKELKQKGVEKGKIRNILDFVKGDTAKARALAEGFAELDKIIESVSLLGYGKKVKIDTSLVRGLEYYTSAVFEISLEGAKWSVAGGGRYDNLIETFGGNPAPATGISLGVERLFELLKAERSQKTLSRVYVANVNGEVKKDAIQLSKSLRDSGIPNEYDLMGRDLRKQLDYANSKGIPYLIVLGPREVKERKARLRDMKSGEEREVSLDRPEEMKLVLEK